jgi:fructoselysine 6-kinase
VRLLGLGDNTFDEYAHAGVAYPGGNAVNVAVRARRVGAEAAYLGRVGADERGRHLLSTLAIEGIDVSRCQIGEEPTAWTRISIVDGERRFLDKDPGARRSLLLDPSDLTYLEGFDVVHSSIYSFLEGQLGEIRRHTKVLSWDCSNRWDEAYLERVAPRLDWIFLSVAEEDAGVACDLVRHCQALGAVNAVVTRGAKGAVVGTAGTIIERPAVPVTPVDTLGAGDAFIATLLVRMRDDAADPIAAVEDAAHSAADACREPGGFGHAVPLRGFTAQVSSGLSSRS